jgi:hypothetical protein
MVAALGLCLILTTVAVACDEPYTAQVPPSSPAAEQPPVDVPVSQGLPVIDYFSAESTEIADGSSVTLMWSVVGATKVSIDKGVGYVG